MARISKEEKERVRLALLATAAAHFAEHGVAGANINAISTDAGFARGTVYNYFESKEALFGAVLHAGTAMTVARARQREGLDPRAKLLALAEEDVVLSRRHEAFVKVMVKELVSSDPSARARLEAATQPLREATVDAIREGQRDGSISTKRTAEELAILFLGQLTMLYVERWSSGGAFPSWEELPSIVVDGFFDGHGRRRPAPNKRPRTSK